MNQNALLLERLPKLTAKILHSIATKCAVNTTGVKSVLISRLADELPRPRLPPSTNALKTCRILSIDMGLKNLAFCVLSVPAASLSSEKPITPTVEAWQKLDITSFAGSTDTTDFSPMLYARKAYLLSRTCLDSYSPSTVVIESQRYRSRGLATVQEWTIRVNMFESMLHAVWRTLEAEKAFEGEVWSSNPGRMTDLWLQGREIPLPKRKKKKVMMAGEEGTVQVTTKITPSISKQIRINLVKEWLLTREVINVGEGAAEVADHFMTAKASVKQDDLADSMLHGMAWIKWERNRLRLLERLLHDEFNPKEFQV